MIRIAHLSDLHFGAADPAAIARLSVCIEQIAPDAVVVTGDVTQHGRRSEFLEAAAFFDALTPTLLIVPGNHDAPVFAPVLRMTKPWRRFRRILKFETGAVLDLAGARVIGLNSARRGSLHPDWSRGRLSRAQIDGASAAALEARPGDLRIVALHHPIQASEGRAGRAVVARAEEALVAFGDARVDLVMTGHAHRAGAFVREAGRSTLVVSTAGTASSTRTRGEAPSYNLIDGDGSAFAVSQLVFDGRFYQAGCVNRFIASGTGWRRG